MGSLLTNVQLLEDSLIALRIFILEEIKKTPALTYHFQESTTGMMILGVAVEVFGKGIDPFRQDSYLNFRGARIRRVSLVRADNLSFSLFRQHETYTPSVSFLGNRYYIEALE